MDKVVSIMHEFCNHNDHVLVKSTEYIIIQFQHIMATKLKTSLLVYGFVFLTNLDSRGINVFNPVSLPSSAQKLPQAVSIIVCVNQNQSKLGIP